RFVEILRKPLGGFPFARTDDMRVHIAAPGWDHWDDPNVYGPMQPAETGSFNFNRQLVNMPRIYPIRDGNGPMTSQNGYRLFLDPFFVLCNGTDSGLCSHASSQYNFLYDFWQENTSGILRTCMMQTRFPSGSFDDGSVMHFKSTFNPGSRKRFDF